jgi:hypothetical protein
MSAQTQQPDPDDKDWTWVITRACAECGFDGPSVPHADIPPLTRRYAQSLATTLGRPDAATRPAPAVWSPLEYACHVRDVCLIFAARLNLMLTEDDPQFENWDQDATAITERYEAQNPAEVGPQLQAAASAIAEAFAVVTNPQWSRPGRRSNGSVFTVDTFACYFLHDLAHHVWDVTRLG